MVAVSAAPAQTKVAGVARLGFSLGCLTVLVVGLIAKLPEAILPIGSDSGMYATYARELLQGVRPYVAFYDVHPPLTYYYWVLLEALGGTDWSRTCLGAWGASLAPQPCISLLAHGCDLALTLVAAALAYAIVRRLGSRPFVGFVAAVCVVWFANESMISMEGSTPTKLTLVPGTFAVYAYLRAVDRRRIHLGWAVAAGAGAMLAALAKQPGLLTLVTLVVCALLVRPRQAADPTTSARTPRPPPAADRTTPARVPRPPPLVDRTTSATRRRLQVLGGIAGGSLLVLLPVLLYLGAIGSLGGFLDEAWWYNAERFSIGYWQTPAGLASPATRIDRVATEAAGLLFVGALLGGLALWRGPPPGHARVLLVWGAVSLVAIAGFREFAQVVPALACLAAVGIGRLWDAAAVDGLGLGSPLAGRLGLVALFGTIFVLSSSFQLIEARRALYERGPGATPSDPERIAAYLRQDAPPGPLFAWGNAGQVYALSGREPATRFDIAEFTNSTSPRPTLSRLEVMDDLQARPPAVIVVDPHASEPGLELSQFPALAQLIQSCYAQVPRQPPNWGVYVRSCG